MNIEHFVRDSLIQIANGVKGAQKALGDDAKINPRFGAYNQIKWSDVAFDIAVTASEASEVSGGVHVLGVFKVGVGGGANSADSHVSRLQFTVPMILPESSHAKGA